MYGSKTTKKERENAEELAFRALSVIASDEEKLWRFLDLSGLDPAGLREAAARPGFPAAVMDHVASDEALLLAVADALDETPERVARAHAILSPPPVEF